MLSNPAFPWPQTDLSHDRRQEEGVALSNIGEQGPSHSEICDLQHISSAWALDVDLNQLMGSKSSQDSV